MSDTPDDPAPESDDEDHGAWRIRKIPGTPPAEPEEPPTPEP